MSRPTTPHHVYVARQPGSRQWGVYIRRAGAMVAELLEGGFFGKDAALAARRQWLADLTAEVAR